MAKSVNHEYEWLIIFLVYNNNYYDPKDKEVNPVDKDKDYRTMEAQTKYILNQIRYSSYSEKVKTIFVEAEIKNSGEGNERKVIATLSMLRKDHGQWLRAEDRVWRDGRPIDIMTDTESLEIILAGLKQRHQAKKHMIITAGHGSILGINYYIPGLKLPGTEETFNKSIERFDIPAAGTSQQELTLTPDQIKKLLLLDNREINEVFKKVFTDKKVDLLVMYNCVMQNLFTQFELRENVEWLVAANSGISIPGFNYKRIINEINTNPSINSEDVAKLFRDTIRIGNNYTKFKEEIEGTWKFTAQRLDTILLDQVQAEFDNLFEIINNLPCKERYKAIDCIGSTVYHLFSYSNYCLEEIKTIDIGIFLECFKNKIISGHATLRDKITPVIEELQTSIAPLKENYCFEGNDFYSGKEFKDADPEYKKFIHNISLLLPTRPFRSDLINGVFKSENYLNEDTKIKNHIPGFLKKFNYGAVIDEVIKTPQ